MKILTAAQMGEVDRRTVEAGIPSLILMENAGARVVEFLERRFAPLTTQRIVVICGGGNNGGDGFVVARQLHTRFHPAALHVVCAVEEADLKGDGANNFRILRACGLTAQTQITGEMRRATLVVDALFGTGFRGPVRGRGAELIAEMNGGFPDAAVVAVDMPSGLESDTQHPEGDTVRAMATVTFTAPKISQVAAASGGATGELHVVPIGSPPELYEQDAAIWLALSQPEQFRHLFKPRIEDSNKGLYGHVLVVAGARGKTGAAGMAGLAALRAGAGLVTVASAASAIATISSYAPELMTEPLPESESGTIAAGTLEHFDKLSHRKNVIALGPGMGGEEETVQVIRKLFNGIKLPMVVDADGLNAMASETDFHAPAPRILTPHPGEMGRLTGKSVAEVQAGRIGVARAFAQKHGVHLVLKGNRTAIAFPDGRVFINPTGSPAMATGGTGDVLTGIIAGLIAQFPKHLDDAVLAAVWLHGRAGELCAAKHGEKSTIATDLFETLPEAMREVATNAPHAL